MIGAGVLALPSVAAPVGFVPSSVALLGVWAYMAVTGMLMSGEFISSYPAIQIPLLHIHAILTISANHGRAYRNFQKSLLTPHARLVVRPAFPYCRLVN